MTMLLFVIMSLVCWLLVVLAPWRAWWCRECLADGVDRAVRTEDLAVLIPARDEADVLARTLCCLAAQSSAAPSVTVIDDQSSDGTASVAKAAGARVIDGAPLPSGWTGKLWALEQARRVITADWLLLLDADIELKQGALAALRARAVDGQCQLVSAMAWLRMDSVWERCLMPAFIFFFKLLYPFALSNSPRAPVAAAAGGCVLIKASVLDDMGGFGAIREAVIDDCSLAKAVKAHGYRTWIGLARNVTSLRRYDALSPIWQMITRTAFAQLRYSAGLLGLCVIGLVLMFWVPVAGLFFPVSRWWAVGACVAMAVSYWPTLRFYARSPLWVLAMPLIGTLFLAMTGHSAWRYWRGLRSRWKNRDYHRRSA